MRRVVVDPQRMGSPADVDAERPPGERRLEDPLSEIPGEEQAVRPAPAQGRQKPQLRDADVHHAPNLVPELLSQHHLSQSCARIGRFQQIRQLAARPPDRNRRPGPRLALGAIDQRAQLLGESAMPTPRLVSGHLHGDGEEAVVIAVRMGLQQRLELFTAGHQEFSHVG